MKSWRCSIIDVWEGSGSEYATFLKIPGFWICLWFCSMPRFWIYLGFWMSRSEYSLVLNIPEFWRCQDDTGFGICLNTCLICQDMSKYAWIWRSMREYYRICLNGFYFTFQRVHTFGHETGGGFFKYWRCLT